MPVLEDPGIWAAASQGILCEMQNSQTALQGNDIPRYDMYPCCLFEQQRGIVNDYLNMLARTKPRNKNTGEKNAASNSR